MKNLAIIIFAILIVSCENKTKKKESVKDPVYKLTEIQELQPTKNVILPGNLDPYFYSKIFPKVKGFVKAIYVDRGTKVKKGQVLTVIEAPEIESQLAEAYSKLSYAESNYSASAALYRRVLKTSKTIGAVALQEIDTSHAKMVADSANVAVAKANIQTVKYLKNYLTVTAPFNGMITERNISVGDLVGPDESNKTAQMFTIEDQSKLRLTVAIPEIYASSIKPNQAVSFKVAAIPERSFNANLSRSSHSLDQKIRSMMTEFDFVNNTQDVKAGMYADLTLPVQRDQPTTFVPNDAIVNSTERIFVIKVNNGIAIWVDIKKGMTVDSLTEVFGNIHKGDLIIAKASDEIKDGQKVKTN